MNQPADKSQDDVPAVDPSDCALFLDLDGTLAPFEVDPAAVGPNKRRNAILRRLVDRLDGRLAVISGRRIADIDRILLGIVPIVAGAHGLERRSARGWLATEPHPAVVMAHQALIDFMASTSSRAKPVKARKASFTKITGSPGFSSVKIMGMRVFSAATTNGPRSLRNSSTVASPFFESLTLPLSPPSD